MNLTKNRISVLNFLEVRPRTDYELSVFYSKNFGFRTYREFIQRLHVGNYVRLDTNGFWHITDLGKEKIYA